MKTVYSLEIEEIRELELKRSRALPSWGESAETLYGSELRGKSAMDGFSQHSFSSHQISQEKQSRASGHDSSISEKHQEQNRDESEANIGSPSVAPPAQGELESGSTQKYVRISLEEIEGFEVVKDQFQHLGVQFINAIALEPSNPAFPAPVGVKVLMGAPKSGSIELTFKEPVKWVSALVTSSRRTILSACDRENKEIARDEMPTSNLTGSNSPIPPNAPLKVQAPAIYKATFYAFDGQLIIRDLSFGF